mgnify:CR=1 FL=1
MVNIGADMNQHRVNIRFFDEVKRVIRFVKQYIRGIHTFKKVGPCITLYGSHRLDQGVYYTQAKALGFALSKAGYAIMTGGGPGIMEAANAGAYEAKGVSCGCAIEIPGEQKVNPYVTHWALFEYFFMRKIMLTRFSIGFIALPGGYGTLDELFEMLTLIVTEKIKCYPVVLFGVDFWHPLYDTLKNHFVKHGTLHQDELDKIFITDSIPDVLSFLEQQLSSSS